MFYAKIGSISEGTLHPEDLIEAMVYELRYLIRESEKRGVFYPSLKGFLVEVEGRAADGAYFQSEEASFDMEELQDHLQHFAPPFCYFGAHPGNGSDIGFWPDTLAMEIDDDDVTRGDEPPGDEIKTGYYLHVNDHGNATMYERQGDKWVEIF